MTLSWKLTCLTQLLLLHILLSGNPSSRGLLECLQLSSWVRNKDPNTRWKQFVMYTKYFPKISVLFQIKTRTYTILICSQLFSTGEHFCVLHRNKLMLRVLVQVFVDGKREGLGKFLSWEARKYYLFILFPLKSVLGESSTLSVMVGISISSSRSGPTSQISSFNFTTCMQRPGILIFSS